MSWNPNHGHPWGGPPPQSAPAYAYGPVGFIPHPGYGLAPPPAAATAQGAWWAPASTWGGGHSPGTGPTGPARPPRSAKYPNLHPVLAEDSTLVRYDVKSKPMESLMTTTYLSASRQEAFARGAKKMRILCKTFPWQIDIVSKTNIVVEDVWNAIYGALQQPLEDSEWGFICQDPKLRERVVKAMKKRLAGNRGETSASPWRVDLVGDTCIFRGLEQDEEFAQTRVMPGAKEIRETWILRLVTPG